MEGDDIVFVENVSSSESTEHDRKFPVRTNPGLVSCLGHNMEKDSDIHNSHLLRLYVA